MIVDNVGIRQIGTGGNYQAVIIDSLNGVDYYSVSPGTYFPNCHEVDPEQFINIDEVDKDYPLDLVDFHTCSKDNVSSETGRDIEDFTDEDWDKVSDYDEEDIEEWKARARGEKREVLEVENSEGEVIGKYEIEWV